MNDEFTTGAVMGLMVGRLESQSEIIRLQAEVIRLQQRIDTMTAPEPTNEEIWFHETAGKTPKAVLEGDSLDEVNKLDEFVHTFVNKHVAPYIHHKAKIALLAYIMHSILEQKSRIQRRQLYAELMTKPPAPDRQAKTQ